MRDLTLDRDALDPYEGGGHRHIAPPVTSDERRPVRMACWLSTRVIVRATPSGSIAPYTLTVTGAGAADGARYARR